MIRKTHMAKALFLATSALFALPVGATSAVFLDTTLYNANRFNVVGTTTTVMRPVSNHFCYLSKVGVVETDTSGELAQCRVRPTGPAGSQVWILEATLGASSDADALCSAICYRH